MVQVVGNPEKLISENLAEDQLLVIKDIVTSLHKYSGRKPGLN